MIKREEQNMNNFCGELTNHLLSKEGFVREGYFSKHKDTYTEIYIKEFHEGNFGVIITNDINEVIDYNEAKEYLISKEKNFSLNVIVVTTGESYINDPTIDNKIVISIDNGKIIYTNNKCEALLSITNEFLNNDKEFIKDLKRFYLTYSLIFINVVLFLICAFKSGDIMDIDAYVLLEMGGKYGPLMVIKDQWWRLITCTFLHGGLMHIVFNMYALFYLGKQIEELYGKLPYIIIYILSGIGGSYLSYYFSPMTLSIGASGAIFGLLGALLIFAFLERGRIKKGAIGNLLVVIGINLAFGLSVGNVDNYGHIGGLLTGVISSLIIYYMFKGIKNKRIGV